MAQKASFGPHRRAARPGGHRGAGVDDAKSADGFFLEDEEDAVGLARAGQRTKDVRAREGEGACLRRPDPG